MTSSVNMLNALHKYLFYHVIQNDATQTHRRRFEDLSFLLVKTRHQLPSNILAVTSHHDWKQVTDITVLGDEIPFVICKRSFGEYTHDKYLRAFCLFVFDC